MTRRLHLSRAGALAAGTLLTVADASAQWAEPPPGPPPPHATADDDGSEGGVFVVVGPSTPPPGAGRRSMLSDDDGALGFVVVGLRATSTLVDGQDGIDREVDAVGAQLGLRAHALGVIDHIAGRLELEGWLGGGSPGIDGEIAAHVALGPALQVGPEDHLYLRLGGGARASGNRAFDVEIARLPSVEIGFQHHGEDLFVDVAPEVALALGTHVGAGDSGDHAPGTGILVGGRTVGSAGPIALAVDYGAVFGETLEAHLGGGSICLIPEGFAGCLDARVAVADLTYRGPDRTSATQGAYLGLSFGIGTMARAGGRGDVDAAPPAPRSTIAR